MIETVSIEVDYGIWIGDYPAGPEPVRIVRKNSQIFATKIGAIRDYVPAGFVTWIFDCDLRKAFCAVAEAGGKNRRFIGGTITVIAPDKISVTWDRFNDPNNPPRRVVFRKDDI